MNLKYFYSYLLKTYSYLAKKERCLSYPEIFAIETTNHCIMSCKMCPRRYMTRPQGHMSFELFKKIINQLQGYSPWLWLHEMGEPLLHPQLGKFIKYARTKGIKTRISTNPVMLNEKTSKMILQSELNLIHIALDGLDQKTYCYIRGKNANYDQALKGIRMFLQLKKKLKKTKPLVRMGLIKMKKTEKLIPKFISKWSAKDIDKIQIKEYKTFDGSAWDIINFAGYKNFSKEFKSEKKIVCRLPWFSVVILWNGKVTPCCNDYDGKYIIGDINKESLKNIWNNNKMRLLRKQCLNDSFPKSHPCYTCKEKNGGIFDMLSYAWQRKFDELKVEAQRIIQKSRPKIIKIKIY